MSDYAIPPAGSAVYLRLHPQSSRMLGVASGPAVLDGWWHRVSGKPWRIVNVSPDGLPTAIQTHSIPAVVLYVARMNHMATARLLHDNPVYCHQNGLGVLVHPSEVCGVLDVAEGKPQPRRGLRLWSDTLPRLDGGAK